MLIHRIFTLVWLLNQHIFKSSNFKLNNLSSFKSRVCSYCSFFFFCLDHPILILLWTIVHCTIRQGEINCDWRRRRCGLCSQFVAVVSLIVWEKQKENWIDEKPRICVFIRNFVSFAFDSNNFILCGLFVFLCPLTNVIY